MKFLVAVINWFIKPIFHPSFFSDAFAEGIKDTFIEMGYRFEKKTGKEPPSTASRNHTG